MLTNELKVTNKKLTEIDKLRTDSLSRELDEIRSPLITINNELELILSGKYGLITTAVQIKFKVLLDRVDEGRKLVESMLVRL
jgi:hypothetical protein